MLPQNLKEFFNGSIHLVFAVVAAQGFLIAGKIFLPIENVLNYDGVASALSLVFAYFFLITSWMGYFKSVHQYPHKENTLGLLRFSAGIFVTFLIYYMITLTGIEERTHYGDLFWVIPILFGILTLAHFIKFKEYVKEFKVEDKANLTIIIYLTLVFFGVFIAHAITYDVITTQTSLQLEFNGVNIWDTIFTISAICLTLFYRIKTWRLYGERPRKRRIKNTKKS